MIIHSVTEVNQYLNKLLSSEPILQNILVRGEISNFKQYTSGHCYFTLKDAQDILKCVMFQSKAKYLRFLPQNGLQVIVEGNIAVYERDGIYQLYTNSIIPEKVGAISLAFAQMKDKLAAKGFFDMEHKKKLPVLPHTIGIITSLSGAVLRDIKHVSKRRYPQIELILYPVQVQGDDSASQIIKAIKFFNEKYPVDVLIIGRGGGSAEDLWSFNEEKVVEAVYHSHIPIISAVGHETDYTLIDFASDVRAATPSQAAELAVPDIAALSQHIFSLREKLFLQIHNYFDMKRQYLDHIFCLLEHKSPRKVLLGNREKLHQKTCELTGLYKKYMIYKANAVALQIKRLEIINPLATLKRGYGLITDNNNRIITSIHDIVLDNKIDIHLYDGKVTVLVQTIKEDVWHGKKERGKF